MTIAEIVVTCLGGALFIAIITFGIVRILKQQAIRAEEKTREVEDVNIKRGVRYTENMTVVDKSGNQNVSFGKDDIVLKKDITFVADHKGYLKPGKYVVLSATSEEDAVNIRKGDFVKEYKHNQKIVVAEGESVTCVSGTAILR